MEQADADGTNVAENLSFDVLINVEIAVSETGDSLITANAQIAEQLQALSQTIDQSLGQMKAAFEIQSSALSLRALAGEGLISTNLKELNYVRSDVETNLDRVSQPLSTLPKDKANVIKTPIASVNTQLEELFTAKEQLIQQNDNIDLMLSKHEQEDFISLPNRLELLDQKLKHAAEEMRRQVNTITTDISEEAAMWRLIQGGIIAASLILAVIIAILSARAIIRPLRQNGGRLNSGNLSAQELKRGSDELGELTHSLSETVNNIRNALGAEQVSWEDLGQQRVRSAELTEQLQSTMESVSSDR